MMIRREFHRLLGAALLVTATGLAAIAEETAGEPPGPPPIEAIGESSTDADRAAAEPALAPDMEKLLPLEWATPTRFAEDAAAERLRAAIEARATAAAGPVAAFYAARRNAPVWTDAAGLSERGRAVRARIARAEEDGLDPRAYALPAEPLRGGAPEDLAEADVMLSVAALRYAEDAMGGRVKPASVGALITAKPPRSEPAEVLGTLADAADVAAALEGFNPPHAQFRLLKAKLAELRGRKPAAKAPHIPSGPALKPGMQDARVPLLRERLGIGGEAPDLAYDGPLAEAVRGFQKAEGLSPTAVVDRRTLARMNEAAGGDATIGDVLANMERWRWMPRDLGATHIFVNVPEYQARVIREGNLVHETRVITGTEKNQTPIFSDELEFIIVNPYWNVPYSIASKEMLPLLQRDPSYLARKGIEVVAQVGKRRQVVNSTAIDWNSANLTKLSFRQPPGERNALGHIKFMFPNEHAVYLHDTPTRDLFSRGARAFSHGCVRVQDPFKLAEVLLEGSAWNAERVRRLIGGSERRIDLSRKVPVHLAYFTLWVGDDGGLRKQADIYGHDGRTRAALGLEPGKRPMLEAEPAVAERAPRRRPQAARSVSRQTLRPATRLPSSGAAQVVRAEPSRRPAGRAEPPQAYVTPTRSAGPVWIAPWFYEAPR